jgi:hypothetical protein
VPPELKESRKGADDAVHDTRGAASALVEKSSGSASAADAKIHFVPPGPIRAR